MRETKLKLKACLLIVTDKDVIANSSWDTYSIFVSSLSNFAMVCPFCPNFSLKISTSARQPEKKNWIHLLNMDKCSVLVIFHVVMLSEIQFISISVLIVFFLLCFVGICMYIVLGSSICPQKRLTLAMFKYMAIRLSYFTRVFLMTRPFFSTKIL